MAMLRHHDLLAASEMWPLMSSGVPSGHYLQKICGHASGKAHGPYRDLCAVQARVDCRELFIILSSMFARWRQLVVSQNDSLTKYVGIQYWKRYWTLPRA